MCVLVSVFTFSNKHIKVLIFLTPLPGFLPGKKLKLGLKKNKTNVMWWIFSDYNAKTRSVNALKIPSHDAKSIMDANVCTPLEKPMPWDEVHRCSIWHSGVINWTLSRLIPIRGIFGGVFVPYAPFARYNILLWHRFHVISCFVMSCNISLWEYTGNMDNKINDIIKL